ncbi:MAG: protein kinase, partial [Acidobacteriota bacterium]
MIGKSISHYSITEKIGEGGMGEVYRARDLKLGRDVGLKLLPELFASDAQRMGRFSREAQLLASLNHPNIASIYGLEEADGGKVLVMELVEGEDLSQRLQRGPIPLTESLELAVQIAEALESAHEKGIIHRDLKPANIKVTPEGKVKVLDFGLAKALEGESEKSSADLTMSPTLSLAATQAGIILGTAAYMSPEQASGLQVDKRADIWSFGVVLFEMLTGGQLFKGETVSHTLADVLRADVDMEALGAATPPAIRSLIRRCLDRNARKRLRDIGEARIAIQEYLANPTKPQDSETVSARPAASQLNKPVVAALLIAAVTVSSLAAWFLKPEPPADSPVKVEAAVWAEQPIPRDQASSAVLSPDGKVLAYITGTSVAETGRLFVRPLNRLDGEFLEGTEGAYNPFFSPDGQWIGYVTARELKKVSVNGGTPLTLCSVSLSRGADWGEQGTIVFAGKPDSGLQQVSVAGGATSEVTSLSEGEVSHRWPQFLPGGKRVLFTSFGSNDRNKGRIEVVDLGSGTRKTILEGGTYGRYSVSGHILYVNNNTLFAASFDPEALELKGLPTPVLEGINMNPEGGAQYSVSLNGTLAYVPGTAEGAKRSLVWLDPQGRETLVSETLKEYRLLRLDPAQRRMALDVFTD